MSLGYYGLLIIFALFFLILIFNPNLSCFGKRIKSPLYPLFRKKKKKLKTTDYGFSLANDAAKQKIERKKQETRTEDYELSLADEKKQESKVRKKKIKTHDYGFSLLDDEDKQKSKVKELK